MYSYRIILSCLFLLPYFFTYGQYHQYKTYTSKDGLTYSETARVFFSENGQLWTEGTSGELCRFNGHRFDCTLMSDLQLSGYIRTMFEYDSLLWIQTHDNPPIFFDGRKWVMPKGGERILNIGKFGDLGIIGLSKKREILTFDSETNTWKEIATLVLTADSFVERRNFATGDHLLRPIIIESLKNGVHKTWVLENPENGKVDLIPTQKNIKYWSKEEQYYIYKGKCFYARDGVSYPIKHKDGRHVISGKDYQINGKWLFGVYQTDNQGNRVAFQLFKPNGAEPPTRVLYLPISTQVFDIEIGPQGDYWLSTHEGLLRANPNVLSFMQSQTNMVSSLHAINEDRLGRIWFGGYGDGLCYYNGKTLKRPGESFRELKRILPGSYRDEKGRVYFWEETNGLIEIEEDSWQQCPKPFFQNGRRVPGYFMYPYGDGGIAMGLNRIGLGLTQTPLNDNHEWMFIGKEKGLELKNVLTVARDRKGRFWCGRISAGLALYDPHLDTAFTWHNSEYPNSPFKVATSAIDERGNLWLGCHDGLKLIRSSHEVPLFDSTLHERLEKVDLGKYRDDKVNGLLLYKNFLVIGGKRGHAFMDLNSFYADEKPKVFFYDTQDPSQGGAGEQNALYLDTKGYLWVGKDRGAMRIDMSALSFDTLGVDILLEDIQAGNEALKILEQDQLLLPPKKRSLRLRVRESFSGYLNDNVDFLYRLKKSNEETTDFQQVPESDEIRIDYLSPGSYTLDFQAIKNNQVVKTRSIKMQVPLILIESPFFWISLVAFIIVGILAILYFQYRSKYRVKQTELQLSKLSAEVDKMQVKAISSALNPHFINNSLHWLQSKMRKDVEAVQLIDRMSENIRMVFSKSRTGEPFHTIKEELHLVKNYLYIQQLRYEDLVESHIPTSEELGELLFITVPLMQIQIHVENAIEHGIRNRLGAGWVKVTVKDEKDKIHIQVADNGIGRKGARELGSGGTQQGVAMLKSLHRIYNQNNSSKIEYWYEDLPYLDKNSGAHFGTIVHIRIPKSFHYAITKN